MDLHSLLRKPIIKIIAVILVLYFGIIKNNQHPQSIANKLSTNNIKKNYDEIRDKISDISQNLEMAQQVKKELSLEKNINDLRFEKIILGTIGESIKCGNEVNIIYKFTNNEGVILDMDEESKIIANQQHSAMVEDIIAKNIVGLKNGAVIRTKFMGQFKQADDKINKLLKIANNELTLEVYILSFKNTENKNCLKNDPKN